MDEGEENEVEEEGVGKKKKERVVLLFLKVLRTVPKTDV